MNPIQETRRFESEIRDYFSVRHCFFVSSGRAALTLILKALHQKYPSRDEVIIPAFTCYSVPAAVEKAGLKVSLCDIDQGSLDLNFEHLKKKISKSGKSILAIVPTHLFGFPANVDQVRQLTSGKGISIVEDAAQAMGGSIGDRKLGTLGDAGFFSLGRGKAFSTIEGGIILTNNDEIGKNITKQLAQIHPGSIWETIKAMVYSFILAIFLNPRFFWFPSSLSFLKLGETFYESGFSIKKLTAFQLGLTRTWQEKLKKYNDSRILNCSFWSDFFQKNIADKLFQPVLFFPASKMPGIRYPVQVSEEYMHPILLSSNELGFGISVTYPDAINNINDLTGRFKDETYPMAARMAKQLITLPVHGFVTQKDRAAIKTMIFKIFTERQAQIKENENNRR